MCLIASNYKSQIEVFRYVFIFVGKKNVSKMVKSRNSFLFI